MPTLLTAFRIAKHITREYTRAVAIADVIDETGMDEADVTRQIDAGIKSLGDQKQLKFIEGCFCHPCQRAGGCGGQPFLDNMRRAAELSVAGYIFGLNRNLDGLEAALRLCSPWHRHHLSNSNRDGEIARRWAVGDAKNAVRMMERP